MTQFLTRYHLPIAPWLCLSHKLPTVRTVFSVGSFQESSCVPIFLGFHGILEETQNFSVLVQLAFTVIHHGKHYNLSPLDFSSPVSATSLHALQTLEILLTWLKDGSEVHLLFITEKHGESHCSLMILFTPGLLSSLFLYLGFFFIWDEEGWQVMVTLIWSYSLRL